jgi:hypothetical protein
MWVEVKFAMPPWPVTTTNFFTSSNHFLGSIKLPHEGLMVCRLTILCGRGGCVWCVGQGSAVRALCLGELRAKAWGPRHNALPAMRYSTYQPRHNAWDARPLNWMFEVAFQRYVSTPRNLHEISSTRLEWEIVFEEVPPIYILLSPPTTHKLLCAFVHKQRDLR